MMQTRTFSAPAPARRRRSPEWEEKRKPYEQLLKARDIDDKTAMTSMARRLTMLQAIRPIPPRCRRRAARALGAQAPAFACRAAGRYNGRQ